MEPGLHSMQTLYLKVLQGRFFYGLDVSFSEKSIFCLNICPQKFHFLAKSNSGGKYRSLLTVWEKIVSILFFTLG